MIPVTDLTASFADPSVPLVTLTWEHAGTGADLADRFMLGYRFNGEWTNLEPQPVAAYGAGPYSAQVAAPPGASWRVLALAADGSVSA